VWSDAVRMVLTNCAGSNVSAYINMVGNTLRTTLPKAAVHCQVREAKRSLLDHFYTQIGKREVHIHALYDDVAHHVFGRGNGGRRCYDDNYCHLLLEVWCCDPVRLSFSVSAKMWDVC
jgi:hypothetical protein